MTEEDRKFILKLAEHLKQIEAKVDEYKIDRQRLDDIEKYLGIGKFKKEESAAPVTPIVKDVGAEIKKIIDTPPSGDPICTITSISMPGSATDMLASNARQNELRTLIMNYCKENKVREMTIFFKD